jgi:hypothetical protein
LKFSERKIKLDQRLAEINRQAKKSYALDRCAKG